MNFLENLTQNLTTEELRPILVALDLKPRPTRKDEMVAALARVWRDEPRRLLGLLSDAERLLLAECAHGDNFRINPVQLHAKHGVSLRPAREDHNDWRKAHAIRCFVERGRYADGSMLVDGLLDRLRELLPVPPPLTVRGVEALPACAEAGPDGRGAPASPVPLRTHEAERPALVELRRVLQLAAADKLLVSDSTGFPTSAAQDAIAATLAAPDLDLALPRSQHTGWRSTAEDPGPTRPFAWPVILQQCRWAKAKAGRLALTPGGRSLLDAFTPERLREGLEAWTADEDFDELRRVGTIKGQGGRRARRGANPLPQRRQAILAALKALPNGQWVTVQEAYRVLQALGLHCRVADDTDGLYVGDARYGTLSYYPGAVARVYFRQVVCESLATLGLVDLAYRYPHFLNPDFDSDRSFDVASYMTAYDGVQFLRVTALGRYCLGLDAAYEPPAQDARALFKVLPNLDVVVTDAASFSTADAALLGRFADQTSDDVWRIGAGSVLRALEGGDTAEGILTVLRAGTDVSIPGTLEQLLRDTCARAGAASGKEPGVLVTFRDAETAALVANDPAAAKAIACHAGQTVAVRERNLTAFRNALRTLGILLP